MVRSTRFELATYCLEGSCSYSNWAMSAYIRQRLYCGHSIDTVNWNPFTDSYKGYPLLSTFKSHFTGGVNGNDWIRTNTLIFSESSYYVIVLLYVSFPKDTFFVNATITPHSRICLSAYPLWFKCSYYLFALLGNGSLYGNRTRKFQRERLVTFANSSNRPFLAQGKGFEPLSLVLETIILPLN